MEPSDLFEQAGKVLQERLAEVARFEGHEAYAEAQPHVEALSASLERARQQVAEAMEKARAAQAGAQAAQAQARQQADAAAGAAASARAAGATIAAASIPEEAPQLDPARIQQAIHTLLRGRARKAADDAPCDDRDIAEAWVDPELPTDAARPAPRPPEPPRRKPRPADPSALPREDSDMEIWEDLPPE